MVTDTGIPAGYKQTEVGVIPEDWDVKKLEEIANVVGGGTPSTYTPDYWNGTINWFTPTEIGLNKYTYNSLRKITDDGLKKCSARILPKGTILLTTRAGIGDVSILMNEGCTNQGFQSLVANDDISYEFLYYLVSTLKNVLIKNASGSTFLEISPNKIKQIEVIIPNLKEQSAIATILSDTDVLIERLEKLIAKKKNIKQGAMQQLLTGKKRLPGFEIKNGCKQTEMGIIPEDWDVKKLNNMATITRLAGYEYSSMWEEKNNGEIIALRGFNIGDNRIIEKDFSRISNELSLKLKRSRLYKNDVIYPCVGTIGNAVVIEDDNKYHIQQNIAKITPNKNEVDSYYLAHYLISHLGLNEITKFNGTSSQPNILVGSLRQYSIVLPSTKSEQSAIATILSDMDAEIESLEQKRDKYTMIKQGMMQQLLTGRIRVHDTD